MHAAMDSCGLTQAPPQATKPPFKSLLGGLASAPSNVNRNWAACYSFLLAASPTLIHVLLQKLSCSP